MAISIELCHGYDCKKRGSRLLKKRLEDVCNGLDYKIFENECSGHCSKGPVISIDGDTFYGNTTIFDQSDNKLRNFLENYHSITKIEGYCKKAKKKDCGLAVDIGTTIIKASLNDLKTGKVYGEVSTINKQGAYGATVLHRWNYFNKAKDKQENLKTLSGIVQKSVDSIQDYFVKKSNANISKVILAGNTAMTYFFLNENPALTIKQKPDYTSMKHKEGKTFLPCVFEWVGGDIVSGMTYLGFDRFDRNVMLIDLGTNGEVAVSTKHGVILTAAASAGPAFEGEGFRCGMPAMKGAIHKVTFKNSKFKYKTLGSKKPAGICGSGMLDLIAEMLANEAIDQSGRLDKEYKGEFFLTKNISIRQEEIDYFKESKAAIFATIQTLLQELGLKYDDLDAVYVAGGFGNMDLGKAQFIGLLPPLGNYEFLGNTSLKGVQACFDKKNLKRSELIAKSSTPIDLTKSDVWMKNYLEALFFPHTNTYLFQDVLKKYMK
jgi:uncharacterized 2Fe-2S/4Fe-4S cluster protein (DUF4445 family)